MMWLIILALVLAASISGIVFLIKRFHSFSFIGKLSSSSRKLSWFLAVLPVVLMIILSALLLNVWATMIILIHLFVFWLVCESAGKLIGKCMKKNVRPDITGCAAILLTVIYLGIGWYLAHHVYRTSYSFTTDKKLGQEKLRIVEIADLHLGLTLDGEKFAEQCERINAEKPDAVIIAGDFVDDDSRRDDMLEACRALGGINSTYGVYYIIGNHDKSYYSTRDFDLDEMYSEFEKYGINVLEDESVLVNDSFYIIGRKDASDKDRLDMDKLTEGLDRTKYMITVDHQPNDYANEADAQVDLVLSGHTHGGHIFPAGQIGLLIGANDRVYGTEKRDNTNFVVTSGISGWAIPFKTGAISEYVVVDINEAK